MVPLRMELEASNFTQVPVQPSCEDSGLKPCPLSNELSIVTAVGQWLLLQTEKRASVPEMGTPTQPEDCFLSPMICTKGAEKWPTHAMLPGPGTETCCPTHSAGTEPKF